jgi:hypothetical protein
MAIWRIRIAWWITKVTDTHSEYVILIGFPLQQWLRESSSMLHCLSCHLQIKRNAFGKENKNKTGKPVQRRYPCLIQTSILPIFWRKWAKNSKSSVGIENVWAIFKGPFVVITFLILIILIINFWTQIYVRRKMTLIVVTNELRCAYDHTGWCL